MASSKKAFMGNINALLSAVVAGFVAAAVVSGFQYEVGEERGWRIPNGKEPQTYNQWAANNRFHIGDTLLQKGFSAGGGSADYLKCNTSNPISKFEDGDTVFQFERSGFFYFISGHPGDCGSGQKLIIRVMHPSELVGAPEPSPYYYDSPAASPWAGSGGDSGRDWGPPGIISDAGVISVASCFMTVLVGVLVGVYLFM